MGDLQAVISFIQTNEIPKSNSLVATSELEVVYYYYLLTRTI